MNIFTENYWQLELWSGDKIPVNPQNAEKIQDIITKGGFIKTPNMTINVKDIKSFNKTERPYIDQKLIGDAARAFNDPVLTEDGSVKSKWVSKNVTSLSWEKFYSRGSYRLLENNGQAVAVAFKLPIHLITDRVTELTDQEIERYHLDRSEN
jgi:hypothetical protein